MLELKIIGLSKLQSLVIHRITASNAADKKPLRGIWNR
jgi:hypothetical protein